MFVNIGLRASNPSSKQFCNGSNLPAFISLHVAVKEKITPHDLEALGSPKQIEEEEAPLEQAMEEKASRVMEKEA